MIWQSILNAAIFGALIGGVVGLLVAVFVRNKCPHCKKRYKLGIWKSRKICPNCGGAIQKRSADGLTDK